MNTTPSGSIGIDHIPIPDEWVAIWRPWSDNPVTLNQAISAFPLVLRSEDFFYGLENIARVEIRLESLYIRETRDFDLFVKMNVYSRISHPVGEKSRCAKY